MNLYAKLREREAQGRPLRVGVIGAGKFAAMYLAQAPRTPGVHVVANRRSFAGRRALPNLERVGWIAESHAAASIDAALEGAAHAHVSEDGRRWVVAPSPRTIVIEATRQYRSPRSSMRLLRFPPPQGT